MKRLFLALMIIVFVSTSTFALEFTLTGSEVTATYTEPTTNADGSSLKDLAKTIIFYDIVDDGLPEVKAVEVPAIALTGGGIVIQTVMVPIVGNQEAEVDFWATAVDTSGNSSDKSVVIRRRIDRLSPAAPK